MRRITDTDEYEYTGADISIPGHTVVESFINILDSGTVQDINVMINYDGEMNFNYIDQIECSLISPYGTIVPLFGYHDIIGSSILYQTVFDDEATTPITSGSAPYNGSYQPIGSLSDIDGEEMHGTWSLWFYNHESITVANFTDWSLTVEYNNR